MRELRRSSRYVGFVRDRPMDRRFQFLAVGRDQRRAMIDAIVVTLRIDNDRLPKLARLFDNSANNARGEGALGIIGQHDRTGVRYRSFGAGDHR